VDPPSWLPDGAIPAAETNTDSEGDGPVSDEAEQEGSAADDPYGFGAAASYSNGQGTAFGADDSSGVAFSQPPDASSVTFDHQDVSGSGFGQQDVSSRSYGHQDTSAGSYGHQDTSAGTYGSQDTSAGSYSRQDTSAGTYGSQDTSAGSFGQQDGPGGTYLRTGSYGQQDLAGGTYGQHDGDLDGGTAVVPPYPAQLAADMPASASPPVTAGHATARRRPAVFSGVKHSKTAAPGTPKARRAELVVARLEPWSVMKFSFLISIVAWVMLFVAVAVIYFALSNLGVFTSIERTLGSVSSGQGSSGVSLSKWFSASRILGYTMLIGAANIILITALSTVGAMIYNLVTHLGGGIEITLKETD